MPDTYESRVAQGESELERAYLQQSLAKIDEWLEHTTGLIPIAAIMVVRNRVDNALRAAQAARVDKEKLEQRVKELEQGITKAIDAVVDIRKGTPFNCDASGMQAAHYHQLGFILDKLAALLTGKDGE